MFPALAISARCGKSAINLPRKNIFKKQPANTHRSAGRGLGLYRRISLLAIIISLFCVVGLASAAYLVTRNLLLTRQSDAIVNQASDHSRQAESLLLSEDLIADGEDTEFEASSIYRFMNSLSSPIGPRIAILLGEDNWFSENPLKFGQQTLPAEFVETAKAGTSVQMRTRISGELLMIVGIPVPSADMVYFEGGSLQDTADILNILRIVVFVGGGITLVISVAVGVLLVRRSFASIRAFRRAAQNIERGSFQPITDPVDSDFQQLKESFNSMQSSVAKRIEREQRFALEVSHELRSPLTTLVASVELINKRRQDMPSETQTALDLLVVEIARFRQLVLDLLEISRPPESIKLDLEVLDAGKFLKRIASRSSANTPVFVENGTARFTADAKLISQVITNLLENASRYAGGSTAIHAQSNLTDLYIFVDDAGPGVSETEREKIFERFTRGEVGAHRRQGLGTGLGLALARERVSLHKGEIWVEDAPSGTGARFVVKLPIDPDLGEHQAGLNDHEAGKK